MKKYVALPLFFVIMVCLFPLLIQSKAQAAAELSDGTYSINYTIRQAENDSVSMANDYFEKPAVLVVKDGTSNVQLQMNHSKWITVFKVPNGSSFAEAKVVSSSASDDTRVVNFNVDDLSKPLETKIHVTIESMDYDHDYTIRFAFDLNSAKKMDSANAKSGQAAEAAAGKSPTSAGTTDAAPSPVKPAVKSDADSAEIAAKAVSVTPAVPSPTPASVPATGKETADNRLAAVPTGTAEKTSAVTMPAGKANAVAKTQTVSNPKTGDAAPVAWLISIALISTLGLVWTIKFKKITGR